MSDWNYKIGERTLRLVGRPEAQWSKFTTDSEDDNFILALVDEEVHLLGEAIKRKETEIDKLQTDIFKLRKWQKALQEKNK